MSSRGETILNGAFTPAAACCAVGTQALAEARTGARTATARVGGRSGIPSRRKAGKRRRARARRPFDGSHARRSAQAQKSPVGDGLRVQAEATRSRSSAGRSTAVRGDVGHLPCLCRPMFHSAEPEFAIAVEDFAGQFLARGEAAVQAQQLEQIRRSACASSGQRRRASHPGWPARRPAGSRVAVLSARGRAGRGCRRRGGLDFSRVGRREKKSWKKSCRRIIMEYSLNIRTGSVKRGASGAAQASIHAGNAPASVGWSEVFASVPTCRMRGRTSRRRSCVPRRRCSGRTGRCRSAGRSRSSVFFRSTGRSQPRRTLFRQARQRGVVAQLLAAPMSGCASATSGAPGSASARRWPSARPAPSRTMPTT